MTYITPDVIDDETAVAEGILASIADRFDGWQPAEGHIVTAQAEGNAIAIATAVAVVKDTVLDAYQGFGQRILQIARGAAGVATAVSTWTLDNDTGMTITAGTEVQATLASGGEVTFIVSEDVEVPPGTTVQLGVVLIAEEAGPDSNGATNPASQYELVGVESVAIDAPASGGADAEDPDEHASRIADRATRLHTIPITPTDHAAFATDVVAVERAVAINLLNPADPGVESTGHVTVYVVDVAGQPLSAPDKADVVAYFAAIERPLNVVVHVEDPTYVDLTVAITVRAIAGADDAAVQAAVQDAITAFADPATFDADPDAPGGWSQDRSTQVSIFDIAAAVDDLELVASVESVTINGGTAPVALPAPVSLPHLTATPTVTVV